MITLTSDSTKSVIINDAGDSTGDATCGTRTYSKVMDLSWVSVTPTVASTGDEITVSASPVGVAAGTYDLVLRVSSTDYTTGQIASRDVSI